MYYSPSSQTQTRPQDNNARRPQGKKYNTHKANDWLFLLYCILTPVYMEAIVRIKNQTPFSSRILVYNFLFYLSTGLLIYLLIRLFPKRNVRYGLTLAVTIVEFVLFGIEMTLYDTFFKQYQAISSIFNSAADITTGGFFGNAVSSTFAHLFELILMLVPIAVLVLFSRHIIKNAKPGGGFKIVCLIVAILSFVLAVIFIKSDDTPGVTDYEFYTSEYNVTEAMSRFGVMPGMRLDIQYLVFGVPEKTIKGGGLSTTANTVSEDSNTSEAETTTEAPKYTENKLDLDFATLSSQTSNSSYKELDEYFASQTPSMKNEYTGLFKGKNCIFITGESFSPYFISQEYTPTLYKMLHEGFVLNDFYQPSWGGSTSDGEYSGLMGLIPAESGANDMKMTEGNNLYTTLGNTFTRLGYYTAAYHANSYTYYDRNLTHENFGYSTFIGYGNGIEAGVDKTWPESDLQAFETVIPWFIDKQPFHIYYMSVSGHPLYTFSGNAMAKKNKDIVDGLPYSDQVKGYYASNYELEYALEYLMEQLEAAGIADDTVIVINPDHYPYGLEKGFSAEVTEDYLTELYQFPINNEFDRDKNACIIYCSSMKEPIVIDAPTFSLDILPTLSNLFGFDFDSRLYSGRDIMSDADPLVFTSSYSWKTDKGTYLTKTKTFTPNEGVTVPDDYVSTISEIVKNKIYVAKSILENDYFNHLFG